MKFRYLGRRGNRHSDVCVGSWSQHARCRSWRDWQRCHNNFVCWLCSFEAVNPAGPTLAGTPHLQTKENFEETEWRECL